MLIFFLFLHENIYCGYSLEAPPRGASNENPQHMFSWRNKKNIMWIPPFICSYDCQYMLVQAVCYTYRLRKVQLINYKKLHVQQKDVGPLPYGFKKGQVTKKSRGQELSFLIVIHHFSIEAASNTIGHF